MLEVLALVPARSGSKGLRDKNVRRLGGATLLARAVGLARSSARRGERWTVVVSTDSERYARLARAAGAEVPFLRPASLATDRARLARVVLHAVAAMRAEGRSFDAVVLLSPTTPLTRVADVRAALELWRDGGESVISVTADRVAPSWRFRLRRGRLVATERSRVRRRQEAPPAFVLNGAIYVAAPEWLERHGQFFVTGATRPLVMPAARSLDIEDADDLALARLRLSGRCGPSRA